MSGPACKERLEFVDILRIFLPSAARLCGGSEPPPLKEAGVGGHHHLKPQRDYRAADRVAGPFWDREERLILLSSDPFEFPNKAQDGMPHYALAPCLAILPVDGEMDD